MDNCKGILKVDRSIWSSLNVDSKHRNAFGMRMSPLHHLKIILIVSLVTNVSCADFFGHSVDEFPVALINITYIDPVTRLLKVDTEDIGRYGIRKFQELTGVVAHVTSSNHTSHFACERLDTDRLPKEPFIALIKHGECRDYVKMLHAAEANASGVVVYSSLLHPKLMKHNHADPEVTYISEHLPIFIINKDNPTQVKALNRNLTSPRLNSLKDSFTAVNVSDLYNSEWKLPYVFISAEKGEEIAQLVDNGTRVMMHIVCSTLTPRNTASVLFVSISFVFLMILMMTWVAFYYVQRFHSIVLKEHFSKRLCTAAQKALEKIPVRTITANDVACSSEEESCAVCIDPLRPNDVIRILPCQHIFHKICVDPWLLDHRSCPMCKLDVVVHYGLVFLGSQESIIAFADSPVPERRNSHIESVHVVASRRNSSSQTSPHLEDRGTSTCIFVQVGEEEEDDPALFRNGMHGLSDNNDVLQEADEDESLLMGQHSIDASDNGGIEIIPRSESSDELNVEVDEIDCN